MRIFAVCAIGIALGIPSLRAAEPGEIPPMVTRADVTQFGAVPNDGKDDTDAIERAGSTDRQAIRDALAQTADFPGLAGTITFTERGDANKGYSKLTIENGRFIRY